MVLKLPDNAEAAFRIQHEALEYRFAIHLYGVGRDGWFVATLRTFGPPQDSGQQPLPRGEWLQLLHFIDRCGFWSLPEGDAHLVEPNTVVDGGDFLDIAGRDPSRYHRIRRYVWREPGLHAILAFAQRVSGFYVRHPLDGGWVLAPDGGEPSTTGSGVE